MGIGEPPPLFRQPVDVGCLHLRRAITSQVAIAQVIGKYEYDVGRLFRCVRTGACDEKEKDLAGKWGQEDDRQKSSCRYLPAKIR
jgi:hypothetical protein